MLAEIMLVRGPQSVSVVSQRQVIAPINLLAAVLLRRIRPPIIPATGISPSVSVAIIRGFGFGVKQTALAVGIMDFFFTCPYAGTISAWTLASDSGTVTIKVLKANGAIPTAAQAINAAGLTAGAYIRSMNLADFTTLTVAAGDVFGVNIVALTGTPVKIFGTIEITEVTPP